MKRRSEWYSTLSIGTFFLTIVIDGIVYYLRTHKGLNRIPTAMINFSDIATELTNITLAGILITVVFGLLAWRNSVQEDEANKGRH